MIPSFDKIHLRFKLNGISYTHSELKIVAYSLVKEGEPYEKVIGDFLLDWLDDKQFINVKTSGSTGQPKLIRVSKQAMVNSAIMTGDYFKLEPGFTALHCLPTHFIAGKMMIVRALILGLELDLVEPSSAPGFDDVKYYQFAAMVPMQVKKSIHRLNNIEVLIVGGATVPKDLIQELQDVNAKVFATYGMTETVSHIALKPLNKIKGKSHYTTLPNVQISKDDRDCLIVDAPNLVSGQVITNDIVDLVTETEFEIIGRFDNMINSGGIKLFPEQIEAKLQEQIKERFFIASETDSVLGEQLILVVEADTNSIEKTLFDGLDKFEIPKKTYVISKFAETASGKVHRSNTLKMLK